MIPIWGSSSHPHNWVLKSTCSAPAASVWAAASICGVFPLFLMYQNLFLCVRTFKLNDLSCKKMLHLGRNAILSSELSLKYSLIIHTPGKFGLKITFIKQESFFLIGNGIWIFQEVMRQCTRAIIVKFICVSTKCDVSKTCQWQEHFWLHCFFSFTNSAGLIMSFFSYRCFKCAVEFWNSKMLWREGNAL